MYDSVLWLLAPQYWELTKLHFTYSRDSPGLLPNLLLAPIIGNLLYIGLSGEVLRRNAVISLL